MTTTQKESEIISNKKMNELKENNENSKVYAPLVNKVKRDARLRIENYVENDSKEVQAFKDAYSGKNLPSSLEVIVEDPNEFPELVRKEYSPKKGISENIKYLMNKGKNAYENVIVPKAKKLAKNARIEAVCDLELARIYSKKTKESTKNLYNEKIVPMAEDGLETLKFAYHKGKENVKRQINKKVDEIQKIKAEAKAEKIQKVENSKINFDDEYKSKTDEKTFDKFNKYVKENNLKIAKENNVYDYLKTNGLNYISTEEILPQDKFKFDKNKLEKKLFSLEQSKEKTDTKINRRKKQKEGNLAKRIMYNLFYTGRDNPESNLNDQKEKINSLEYSLTNENNNLIEERKYLHEELNKATSAYMAEGRKIEILEVGIKNLENEKEIMTFKYNPFSSKKRELNKKINTYQKRIKDTNENQLDIFEKVKEINNFYEANLDEKKYLTNLTTNLIDERKNYESQKQSYRFIK